MKIKMFGNKSLSMLLFYVTKIAAIGYSLFLAFILLSLVTKSFIKNEEGAFIIKIPFTDSVIKGAFDIKTIVAIILFLLFYISFFYLLSLIFKTFKAETLFSMIAIRHLTYFTWFNLILPFLYVILQVIILSKVSFSELSGAFLHIVIGIFAAFIASIFKQGVEIQEENELTI